MDLYRIPRVIFMIITQVAFLFKRSIQAGPLRQLKLENCNKKYFYNCYVFVVNFSTQFQA